MKTGKADGLQRNGTTRTDLQRRNFLKYGSLAALAAWGFPDLLASENCPATTPDILGPFYQPNAPFRTEIAAPGEPGQRLVISGAVSDCKGPVQGAVVEVWQANAAGCYSINEDCGVVPGNPDNFRLRGRVRTDERGRYEFATIKPAAYLGGGNFRPSHIHYKVTVPSAQGPGKSDLVTQLYFEGDKYLDTDRHSSKPEAKSRIISLQDGSSGGPVRGTFNLVLPRASTTKAFFMEGYDLLVERYAGRTRFFVPEDSIGRGVLGVYGTDGTLLRQWEIVDRSVEWNTERMAAGIYVVQLHDGDEIEQVVHVRI